MSEISLENLMYSLEKEEQEKPTPSKSEEPKPDTPSPSNKSTPDSHKIAGKKAGGKKDVMDFLKEVPGKADHITKRFRLWARKRKNLGFYKKYLDRVEAGLMSRYGEEAKVNESVMLGDPVEILKGTAQTYIRTLVKNINSLYETILKMSDALETKVTAEGAIQVVQKYCSEGIDEDITGSKKDSEKLPWKERILNATKYKLAKILLSGRDSEIYGFTVKNMVLKKFPTPNHLIVTLFMEDPQEYPREQPVTDIFRTPESFRILADSDKQDIFNVVNMTSSVLNKTVDNKIMNEIQERKNKALVAFKNAEIDDKKAEAKIIDSIWDGINKSCKLLLSKKAYLIECINTYYDMILRIDKLAVNCIKEMLMVETKYRDARYDRHAKLKNKFGHKTGSNKYIEEEEDHRSYKNAGARQEKYNRINNAARDINKRM